MVTSRLGVPLSHRADSNVGHQPAPVIQQLDQVFEKNVLAEQGQHRQSQRITRNRDEGLGRVFESIRGMLVKIAPAQQGAPQ